MDGCFFNFVTVNEITETVVEFVWRLAHGEEISFQVLLGYGHVAGFYELTYFHGDSGEFVSSDTTKDTKEVFLQFSEVS